MNIVKKIILSITLLLLMLSCKKGVTDNGGEEEKRIKTPREMTWTADTLKPLEDAFQLTPQNLLVFSTNDIWLCCDSDVARGLLWHYDGKKWSESNIRDDVGGMRVNDIAGYSSNDLWAAGYSGENIFLAHYNGQHWTRESNMGIKGELLDMCKDPDGNLWACGRNGVVLKYDKSRWIADTIKIHFAIPTEYFLKSSDYYNKKIFALATTVNKTSLVTKYYYVNGDMHNWTIADSMTFDLSLKKVKWGNWGLFSGSFNQLYSFGDVGSWLYDNNNWIAHNNSSATLMGMYGISKDYMIAVGNVNQILYFDGNSWTNISSLFQLNHASYTFTNVWTDGYETFLMCYGNIRGNTGAIIFHGK